MGLAISALGQSTEYRNYNVKDGLPSSEVYNAMQDSKGFMWFATDKGVCRFDGYGFKTFTTNDGLADNTVFECEEDYKGRIWFRSLSGRLSYYYNDSIHALSINDSLSHLLSSIMVSSISVDTLDNIYLGLPGIANGIKGIIKINIRNPRSLSVISIQPDIYYIALPAGGPAFIGNTLLPMSPWFKKKKAPLHIFHLAPNAPYLSEIKTCQTKIPESIEIHNRAILLKNGKIAASFNTSIIIIDTMRQTFPLFKSLNNEYLINVNTDNAQNLWISGEKGPRYLVNGEFADRHLPSILSLKCVTSIVEDKEGGTWFTTLIGGVYYMNSLSFKIYNSDNGLPGDKINVLSIAPDGNIWTSSEHDDRLAIIHPNDSVTFHKIPQIHGFTINTILLSNDNTVWVGSTGGLNIFKNDKLFSPLATNNTLGQYNLVGNNDGTCWLNSYSTLETAKRNGSQLPLKKLTYCGAKVTSLCKDFNQNIWVGTIKGLRCYRNDSLVNYGDKYPVFKKRINDIKQHANGDLWIAARDTGIIILKGNKLNYITTKDGLPSNFCQCLCIDYKGNVWVGTNKGISHILLQKNKPGNLVDTIININLPNLVEINKLECRGDTIYAATSSGITVFNMNNVTTNKIQPPIYVTDIKVNNKSRELSSLGNLKYDENYLLISFVGLTYKDAGNTRYRYKMEGIDTGWIYTKNRDVQYPKMQPGNYTFLVSAMNNDGIWNQKPATIHINITPPFWATWWARISFILAIASFIYWRFKVVETRTKKDADVNKQLVTMELKELKAQMDPHFLFNNLNTLTHLVELKSDDAPEFVEELAKYYRYSLQFRNAEFTLLENELKQADRYLHILKIRFGDNLKVSWNIKESLRTHYLATYSLQLLLENITKHNIVSVDKPLRVEITTTELGTLVVKNQLQLKNSSALSNQHGLKSINQRYQLLLLKNIEVSQTSEYFSVELPLITPAEYENINS
jgi:ligand-binding sensor domain-containing protein